jgi:hypothetical protein
MRERIEVELWNTEVECVAAVRATIAGLPGNGELIEDGWKFYLTGEPIGFVAFACERQGYVKRVVR